MVVVSFRPYPGPQAVGQLNAHTGRSQNHEEIQRPALSGCQQLGKPHAQRGNPANDENRSYQH